MNKFKIAHISDSHFGTVLPSTLEKLERTLQQLGPNLIVLSGDITQRSKKEQYLEASHFLARCHFSNQLIVPGNHDISLFNFFERLFFPYKKYKDFISSTLTPTFLMDDIGVLGLNSSSRWRHIQGKLNHNKLDLLIKKYLNDCNIKILVFHHPLDCLQSSDEKNLIRNRYEIAKCLSDNLVDLTLSGHIHFPLIRLSEGSYKGLKNNFLISNAGTCSSWRIRRQAPNSFNLVEIEQQVESKQINIHRYDDFGDSFFKVAETHSFISPVMENWRANKLEK